MEDKEVKKNTAKKRSSKIEKENEQIKKTKEKNKEKKEEFDDYVPTDEELEKKIEEKKNGFNTLEVIIIMFITLCIGCFIGNVVAYGKTTTVEKKVIVKESDLPEEFQEFFNTYNDILDTYYEEIDSKKLIEYGIKGMINYLGDKYSIYMNTTETESFNQEVEGYYSGIGCELRLEDDGKIMISKIFEDSPSEKAGLKVGDIIYKLEGEEIGETTPTELSTKVKGKDGTKVNLTVLRNNKEIELEIERTRISIPSVTSEIYEKNNKKIGYIYIDVFASNTAQQFKDELEQLEKDGIESLIVDVRDNSGGYLSTVKEIASMFVDKTKTIYQLDTRGEVEEVKSDSKEKRTYPIVVLVNHYSASASEILAAALMESYGADVVGVNTFGKGTVQKAYQLESGATVKYTIQKWLTPNGNWINGTGITPTEKVELDADYYDDPTPENDNQLQEALNIISKK